MAGNVTRMLVGALLCSLPASAAWADGAVYAMTNALGKNQVLVYHRASNGTLNLIQTIATGGGGSGLQLAGVDAMGSAGSVQLDEKHRHLFVVNTETLQENNGAGAYNQDCQEGSITSFSVAADGKLKFANRVFSGGLFPSSLTVKKATGDEKTSKSGGVAKDVLYVLNAGGPGSPACRNTPHITGVPNITGFTVAKDGVMTPVGSVQASAQQIDPGPATALTGESCLTASANGFQTLTGAPAADFACGLNPPSFARSPAQVRFTPDGDQLLVSVKGTNTIYVFPVNDNGRLGNPTITQAPGPALPSYFGFTFDPKGHLIITELFGTATSIPQGATGAVSSFTITKAGHLTPLSRSIGDQGTAACWIAIDPVTGKFLFVSNNLSNTISSYQVAGDGALLLKSAAAASAPTPPATTSLSSVSGPNDLAVAVEGDASYLYVVNAGNGTVGAFSIGKAGALKPLPAGTGLPVKSSAQGLAAY